MSDGWTVRDNVRGTVGIGREPWKSRQEAEKWVADEDRKRITRALKVTIESMEMDLNRLPSKPIDGNSYIMNLEAHANEVAYLNPTVARSIRVTMRDMEADMARRGEVGLVALKYYVENLKEDLKRI